MKSDVRDQPGAPEAEHSGANSAASRLRSSSEASPVGSSAFDDRDRCGWCGADRRSRLGRFPQTIAGLTFETVYAGCGRHRRGTARCCSHSGHFHPMPGAAGMDLRLATLVLSVSVFDLPLRSVTQSAHTFQRDTPVVGTSDPISA